ncbi:DUF2059 domain-containing protein [Flavobacterium algicola]|uniref:DUF2059 domain-containing protein n=1 Tax=Flavobacterium algicola TaxID=556529 RepID=UPI001EFD4D26|nr:DUF2059 domain-containing protein [Flavobacterium algicola]MCG9792728.1 DUF2059 domain-containing protein [Flavobacterium algicola]
MKAKLFALFLLTTVTFSFAQTSESKTAAIHELLNLTGSAKMGIQVGQAVMNSMRKSQPDVPEEFWEESEKEFNAENLIELIVPIYDDNYSEAEINGLIAFYKTTLGQKVISTLPIVVSQSMEAGRQWGSQLSFKIYKRLKDKKLLKE